MENEGWGDLLHPNSPLKVGESLCTILAFSLRHHLTKCAIDDLLKLLNCHFPGTFSPSKFFFFRKFCNISEDMESHVYCRACQNYFGIVDGSVTCSHCETVNCVPENIKEGCFFFYLPIKKQLEQLLDDTLIADNVCNENFGCISQGVMYKSIVTDCDLSLMWNCDGVPVFKSSSFSVWPLQYVLNELPHKLQRENVLLAGLGFGQSKPRIDTFLKPFVAESESLLVTWKKDGITLNSKVHIILCTADAIARPLLRNTMQFNGRYGCDWCCDEGQQVNKGRGMVRVYPYDPSTKLRDAHSHTEAALQATNSNSTINGVKGVSVIQAIPSFDIISGFVPDYMHSTLLGVARQFGNLWFETSNHDKPWFLSNAKLQLVDSFMLAQNAN